MTATRALVLRASAKINLTLRVGEVRSDGFHDVRTLLQSIAMFDTVTVSARPGPFRLMTRSPGVPTDETNLVWKAAAALWQAAGRNGEPRDAHVRLDKQIPVAAGLGGGSADAAAALVALNEAWLLRLPRHELAAVGSRLGADVPFFLQGGTALGLAKGDELYPVDDVQRMGVVVIKPSFGVPTADAYRWFDADKAAAAGHSEPAGRAVELGWPTGPVALLNDLQGPVAARFPMVTEMVDACLREGALGAAMTGSGSAVFGLFPEGAATRVAGRLARPDWLVTPTRTLGRREASRRMTL